MMKAEVTAENKPACDMDQYVHVSMVCTHTNMSVVSRSSPYFFMNSLSYSPASLR